MARKLRVQYPGALCHVMNRGDPHKLRIAQRLRQETTMSLAWIAQNLFMGAAGHLSCLLYRKRNKDDFIEEGQRGRE